MHFVLIALAVVWLGIAAFALVICRVIKENERAIAEREAGR